MSFREDFVFWRLAHFFSVENNYRLINFSEDKKEIWLENLSNKKMPIIRLLRHDLDWGNKLKRDIQIVGYQGDKLRKHLLKRELNIMNIYISTYPPVDEYEKYLQSPLLINKKTKLYNVLVDRANMDEKLAKVAEYIQQQLEFEWKMDYEETEVQVVKQAVLAKAISESKQEKQVFEYGKPFFTYVFIAIQLLMFILMEVMGGSQNIETLMRFGAKSNIAIVEGEWWRFITPMFLHIGLLHLVMNTLALFYLGTAVEKMFGRVRFLIIYFFAGIMGTIASFVFSSQLSAGASGAIFGCFGALLYLGVVYPKLFFRTIGMNVIVLIVINLFFGFTVPGIDNAGHIGGLVGGFIATGIVHFPKKRRFLMQISFSLLAITTTAVLLFLGFNGWKNEMVYALADKQIKEANYDEAYSLLTNYLENHEGNPLAYFYLAHSEYQLKKTEDAKVHLSKAIEMEPGFHEAYYSLAFITFEEHQFEQAKAYILKAIELSDQEHYRALLRDIETLETKTLTEDHV